MEAFRIANDCTFISKALILESVPKPTVENGISQYKAGKTKNWATISLQTGEYVQWESLGKVTTDKIGEIDKILAQSLVSEPDSVVPDSSINDIELILDLAWSQRRIYSRYYYFYEDRYFYSHEILLYAQMHSLYDSIIFTKRSGDYSLKTIHSAVENLRTKRKFYNFKVGNFKYFKQKIRDLECLGIDSLVINANKHKPKEKIKLTKYVKGCIIKFYTQTSPTRLNYIEITEHVNTQIKKAGYPTIHLSSTKKFLASPEIQNRFKPFRFGKEWVKKHLDPFVVRSHPLYIHDKWEIDGTVLPFYVMINKKITRLWLMIIVDVHSRKIIGYGIDYHETSILVYRTYRMAIANTRALAREIVRDNAKAYDSKLICELESQFESDEIQCLVRRARVGNAKDKGTVEKVLDILNITEFSKCEGWIGDPWDSERELYRLDSKDVNELRKTANVLVPKTVFEYVDMAIANLNNKTF